RKMSKISFPLVLLSVGLFACNQEVKEATGKTIGRRAPEISEKEWINNPPLTMAQLHGKVVALEFWEYTCVNCLRTLPHVKAWHRKYASQGLVVLGVHTPEFEGSKKRANVEKAVRELQIKYPVVLDNDYVIWNAFGNNWWPRIFLIDKKGVIRYDHIGEGAYGKTEAKIQELLREAAPKELSILPDSTQN
ncbi:MAG: redoxin domain-containing protein, partial [Limisphaerales bacterium]